MDFRVLLLILMILLFLLWLLLQYLLYKERQQSRDQSYEDLMEKYSRDIGRNDQAQKESELRKLLQMAKEGSEEDKELAQEALRRLLKAVRAGKKQWQDLASDQELLKKLAERMDLEDILSYSQALDLVLPEIKAETTSEMQRSLFPTLQTDIQPTSDINDVLLAGDPIQLYQRDDTYAKLATGDLQVVTYWDKVVTEAVLHLIVDVSNSMTLPMRSGVLKRILARSVVYRLLTRSVRGAAKFLLRFFDGGVSPLKKAMTPDEVDKLATLVRDNEFLGSGTEILGAIETAVQDIRAETKLNPRFVADIMLITDGEPNTPFTEKELRKTLGDIRLHVIIIGDEDNQVLKKVATSYDRKN